VSEKKHSCEGRHVQIVTNRFEETIEWMQSLNIPGLANPLEIENIQNERHLIYTLLVNNLVGGYIKVGKGKVFVTDFKSMFIFPQDSAFIMDSFIHPMFRGKKLFHPLIARVINDLKEAGYKHLYCHIRIDNLPSIAAYGKSGFRKISEISYKKMLWKQEVDFPTDILDALTITGKNETF
jgi:ribosomal protein S18 acetylase RimI-like enzyme